MTSSQTITQSSGGWLDRENTIAQAGFNRWMVPPAALAIHLCIGMAYGLSVFWLPLSRVIGIAKSVACPDGAGFMTRLTSVSCDWQIADVGWIFSIGIVVLGASAALFGGWLEKHGPRKAGVVAAVCWSGGFLISAYGIYVHQLWMLWIGSGVIGGIGLGLGYISPVSTLIKWFPDRRGMATGMAIMGFGGGALIGAPLANNLMAHFAGPETVGVWQTFAVMGVIYFVFMMGGALAYRVPPAGWQPEGWVPTSASSGMITSRDVDLKDAHKTPQFWMIWIVLCFNVSAGIGVLYVASPILQEVFAGKLIGAPDVSFLQLDAGQKAAVAAIAAGFVGLLSLFNIGGRFFWATISDKIGRKLTYATFFSLGFVLYAGAPYLAHSGNRALFVLTFCIILSMYGGGFATVPAYLADMFGTKFVGAIHGRLLTAWSTAGILGPVVVSYIRDAQISAGVPRSDVYDRTMLILAGFLLIGFIANLMIRPVADKWYMTPDRTAPSAAVKSAQAGAFGIGRGGFSLPALIAWAIVGIPILWGIWDTLKKALVLFS
jgi:MFS family permease